MGTNPRTTLRVWKHVFPIREQFLAARGVREPQVHGEGAGGNDDGKMARLWFNFGKTNVFFVVFRSSKDNLNKTYLQLHLLSGLFDPMFNGIRQRKEVGASLPFRGQARAMSAGEKGSCSW